MPSNSLEQEAMDRVRRMYASFDRPPAQRPSPPPKEAQEHHEHHEPAHPPQVDEHRQPDPVHTEPGRGMLELLMQDKDQSLILLLLVILMKDGADMNLLLALVYILL